MARAPISSSWQETRPDLYSLFEELDQHAQLSQPVDRRGNGHAQADESWTYPADNLGRPATEPRIAGKACCAQDRALRLLRKRRPDREQRRRPSRRIRAADL